MGCPFFIDPGNVSCVRELMFEFITPSASFHNKTAQAKQGG